MATGTKNLNQNGNLYFIDAELLRVYLRNIVRYAEKGSDYAELSIRCCQLLKILASDAAAIVDDAIGVQDDKTGGKPG